MTTHNIQNIFGLRHHFHSENDGHPHRPHNFTRGFLARITSKLQAVLTNSLRHRHEANEIRKAIEHLNAMDDEQLFDLGITRPDIPRVVKYGKGSL